MSDIYENPTTLQVPKLELKTLEVLVDSGDASGFMYLQTYVDSEFENLNFNIEPDPDSSMKLLKIIIYILYCVSIVVIENVFLSIRLKLFSITNRQF